MDQEENQVFLDPMANPDLQDPLGNEVRMVLQADQDHKDPQDLEENLEHPEQMVNQDNVVNLELQVHKVVQDRKDLKVLRVREDLRVSVVQQDQGEKLDLKDHRVNLEEMVCAHFSAS